MKSCNSSSNCFTLSWGKPFKSACNFCNLSLINTEGILFNVSILSTVLTFNSLNALAFATNSSSLARASARARSRNSLADNCSVGTAVDNVLHLISPTGTWREYRNMLAMSLGGLVTAIVLRKW